MLKFLNIIWLVENVFTLYGGGKDGGDAPDYTALARASERAAEIAAELGREQLAESKRQYENNMTIAKPVVQAQLGLMNQQQVQGDDYFNYGKQYSRPVEKQLYYESMGFTPEEVEQIEASRSAEIAKFNETQEARQQAKIPTTFEVPTTETKIPEGAVKGGALKTITIPNPEPKPSNSTGLSNIMAVQKWKPTVTVNADPNAYYLKNADGTYKPVALETVTGTKTITVDTPVGADGTYTAQDTPETDALTSKLSMAAAARLKEGDAAARAELLGLNTNLATRIGESDVDVYLRNRADIDAETGQAVADARTGFTNATNNVIRQGLRYGMSPEKLLAANARNATNQASQQAGAANFTRKNAVNTMYQRGVGEAGQMLTGGNVNRQNKIQDESIATAKKLDVAGLYRGLPSASAGAYGLSLNAGNSAVQNNAQAGQQLLQGNQMGANTILQGSQQQISGLTSILNSQTSMANNSGDDAGIWGALGNVGGAAISKWSDENVKKDVKKVSEDDALDGIKKVNVKSWKYDKNKIDGQDDKRHIGAMAQDMQKNLGEEVSDGRMVDVISAIGMNMAATKALAKKVDKLGKSK